MMKLKRLVSSFTIGITHTVCSNFYSQTEFCIVYCRCIIIPRNQTKTISKEAFLPLLKLMFIFFIIYVHFRYLDSCQLIGGLATPVLDACHEEIQDSCTSFKREDCIYSGIVVYNRTSVNNAHSCQSLLTTIGNVYGGVYFVYDNIHHTCTFYNSKEASCSAFSGPDVPDIESCNVH